MLDSGLCLDYNCRTVFMFPRFFLGFLTRDGNQKMVQVENWFQIVELVPNRLSHLPQYAFQKLVGYASCIGLCKLRSGHTSPSCQSCQNNDTLVCHLYVLSLGFLFLFFLSFILFLVLVWCHLHSLLFQIPLPALVVCTICVCRNKD